MRVMRHLFGGVAALLVGLAIPAGAAETPVKSPDQVRKALTVLNRVVDHTGRLITARNYGHVPHEHEEFVEGVEALEKGIAPEDSAFKSRVEPLIKAAALNSEHVADAAKAKDDARLAATHADLATSVTALLAEFPATVRPRATEGGKGKADGTPRH